MSSGHRLFPARPADLPFLAAIETAAMQSSPLNSVFFHNWASLRAQMATFQRQIATAMATPHVKVVKAVSVATGTIDGFVIWKTLEQEGCSAGDTDSHAREQDDHSSTDMENQTPAWKHQAGVSYTHAAAPETPAAPDRALNMPFCGVAMAATERLKETLVRERRCVCTCLRSSPPPKHHAPYPLLYRADIDIARSFRGVDLNRLFVRPSSQGRGVGSMLVARVLAWAEVARRDVYLISLPHPHAFYRKLGFVDKESWDVDLRPWGPEFGGLGVFRFQGMVRYSGGGTREDAVVRGEAL
ncbi:hypothetical protein MMC26_005952 [Xylographa opegraphella]|nr:hypothetical protein [Xylographa opegraphella]